MKARSAALIIDKCGGAKPLPLLLRRLLFFPLLFLLLGFLFFCQRPFRFRVGLVFWALAGLCVRWAIGPLLIRLPLAILIGFLLIRLPLSGLICLLLIRLPLAILIGFLLIRLTLASLIGLLFIRLALAGLIGLLLILLLFAGLI